MSTYTTSQVLQHMAPLTLVSWIADMDRAPDNLSADDIRLMHFAMQYLFAAVGAEEGLTMLETAGVDAEQPVLVEVLTLWNAEAQP